MSSATYNITIEQGATWRRSLTVYDGSGGLYDFTNYTARMQIRPTIRSPRTMLSLYSEAPTGGITLTTLGSIDINIGATLSSGFTQYKGVYDLEIETTDGIVYRLLQGTVRVYPEVTR